MPPDKSEEPGPDVDLATLSPESLVDIIQQLEGSIHQQLRKRAQKELVDRLKQQGFRNHQIATLLTTNVYGTVKKKAIVREWAAALGITPQEFLKVIGM